MMDIITSDLDRMEMNDVSKYDSKFDDELKQFEIDLGLNLVANVSSTNAKRMSKEVLWKDKRFLFLYV